MVSVRNIAGIVTLLLAASLAGCSTSSTWLTGNYQDPDLHLVKVEVVKARLLQQRFILHFRLDNPNDATLPVRGLAYRIHLGDVLLAEGYSEEWFTAGANRSSYFSIPIRTDLWAHLRELAKMARARENPVPYRLEGELETGLLFGHTQQLSRSGEIIPQNFIAERHK